MRVHELKIWPTYYEETLSGRMPFSIRDNHGRGFQRGDEVRLCEWDPEKKDYTGRVFVATVTYVESAWGVTPGHVVLGFGSEV